MSTTWPILLAAVVTLGVAVRLSFRPVVTRWVRARLGPYRRPVSHVDPALPERAATPRRVAVIGGGLAGVAAAATLGERGFTVDLYEAEPWLGGKLAAWDATASDGETVPVEHGFHAFFRHYYNLDRFLVRLGIRQTFRPIEDYLILRRDGGRAGYRDLETTPLLNLLDLARHGAFRWREILLTPALHRMGALLEYDPERTFAQHDDTSYAAFAEAAHLPPSLRLQFNAFSRAFFASDDRLSMAELIKSFHFYYLSQDAGLVYDHPVRDHRTSLWEPIRRHLDACGVTVHLATPARAVGRAGQGFTVNDRTYDGVVIATQAIVAKQIALASPWLRDEAPEAARRLETLGTGQRYAVLRLWLDGDVTHDGPPYFVVERPDLLDAVALYHRIEEESASWAREQGGSVIELHCYAVPDAVADDAVRDRLVADLTGYFPEVASRAVLREHLLLKDDFTALHVGMHASRPGTHTGVPGLVLAGDWVRLPFAAMLMEAAFTSGLVAANALLAREGLRQVLVEAVPPRGVLGPR